MNQVKLLTKVIKDYIEFCNFFHYLGCCADDEECKCFGDVEEMDEENEVPPRCIPLNRKLAPPQFCMATRK